MPMTDAFDPPEPAAASRSSAGVSGGGARVGLVIAATKAVLQRNAPSPTRRSHPAGASVYLLKEDSMFEGQPQAELDAILQGNSEFKQLYQRHKQLDKQVLDAELGVLPVDDFTLSQMKREKLAAKDRLTRLFDVLHH
jgi:uncharacterized protein